MQVYKAIAAVAAELAQVGVGKLRKNEQQGFRFRGIDDVMNALSPVMARHGLMLLPRVLSRTVTERTNAKGTALFYTVLDVEYDIVSAEDASKHTVRVMGEAMDSGDKATNKAMSAAYKYAAFQAFCIPVDGTPDADATTYEVEPAEPQGFAQWLLDLEAVSEIGAAAVAEAWRVSRPEFKTYAKAFHDANLTAIKARAAAVQVPVVGA